MSKLSFIIADDDARVVTEVCGLVAGFSRWWKQEVQCLPAYSGSEVLDLFEGCNDEVDALFLDFDFGGGMNGEEILHELADPFKQLFVVLMSGREPSILENVVRRGLRGHGERFHFVQKPVTPLMLQQAFDRAVGFSESRPLPYLLAYPLARMEHPDSSFGRMAAVKDLFEVIFIYSAIILLAELQQKVSSIPSTWPVKEMNKITMGGWLAVVEGLRQKAARRRRHFMPELVGFLSGKGADSRPLDMIRDFKNELRDPIMGHGMTLDERTYERLAAPYGERALSLARKLSFMARYPIFAIDHIDYHHGSPQPHHFRSRLLMGTQYPYLKVDWRSDSPHQRRRVYVRRRSGDTMLLDPFLRLESCPQCQRDQLFFADELKANILEYRSVCNHRVKFAQ